MLKWTTLALAVFAMVFALMIACGDDDDSDDQSGGSDDATDDDDDDDDQADGECDANCIIEFDPILVTCIDETYNCLQGCGDEDTNCIGLCTLQMDACREDYSACFEDCKSCRWERQNCYNAGSKPDDFELCIANYWLCNGWDEDCFDDCETAWEQCASVCSGGCPCEAAECYLECDEAAIHCETACVS